jgi:protein tyrosine/serine phosphatase
MKQLTMQLTILGLFAALAIQSHAQDVAEPVPAPPTRPGHWAEPMIVEGVPNLHRISPTLYRSEQPTALGMKNLEKLGIRTVINLRHFNNDDEEVKGTSLRTERIKILTWRINDRHVIEVMRMLRKTENGPFLIHCQHGADRTGLMSAMYRILEQGWAPDDALKELVDGGYGYHSMWKNIVRYVRSVDAAGLRSAIGSTSTVTDNL